MTKSLLAATALCLVSVTGFAADLPSRAPAPSPVPVLAVAPVASWSGLYVGVVAGYADGASSSTPTGLLAGAGVVKTDIDGALVGGQVGYNFDMGNRLVLGAVADLSWSGVKGKTCIESNNRLPCIGVNATDSYSKSSLSWLGTVRAKGGFAVSNDVLLYVTGGLAAGGAKGSVSYLTSSSDPIVSDSQTHYGWTVGAGLEYKLTQAISVGAEYLYADLGKKSYDFTNAGVSDLVGLGAYGADARLKLHIVRASLNYRFGQVAGPVIARY